MINGVEIILQDSETGHGAAGAGISPHGIVLCAGKQKDKCR
jgi:hypothetical protein